VVDVEDGTWRYQWPAGSRFLVEIDSLVQVAGRRVIDLGCGQGRLGCWALEHGAAQVVFADQSAAALAAIPVHAQAMLLEHRWGEPLPVCDILLGGDILYRPACFVDLLTSVGTALAVGSVAWLVDPRSTLDAELPGIAASLGLQWLPERRSAGYTAIRIVRDHAG
jgi:predicted nicotinamide N-methyase